MKVVERSAKIRLKHIYADPDGAGQTPTTPKVNVYDPSMAKKVDGATPTLATGFQFYYDLTVLGTDPIGYWMVEWLDGTVLQPNLQNNQGREIFEVIETRAGIHPARQGQQ